MKLKCFWLTVLCIAFTSINAQVPSVYGIVKDAFTGEAIQGVVVFDSATSGTGISNTHGYYDITANNGYNSLVFTAPGYLTAVHLVRVFGPVSLDIELSPIGDEQTQNNQANSILNDYQIGHIMPLSKQIKDMPAIANEQDPVKFLQNLPGAKGGMEGMSGLYVRGGNNDNNLMMMDGIPVFGSGHLFGFLSPFQPNSFRDIQFYRGPAPARYGGRASSVTDVSMKEGNTNEFNGEMGINLLDLFVNANGPLDKAGKTTINIGIRKSWLDVLTRSNDNSTLNFGFHDLNAKVVFRPSQYSKLSVWVYNGRDKYGFNLKDSGFVDTTKTFEASVFKLQTKWQSTITGVNYMARINKKIFANFIVGYSHFKTNNIVNLRLSTYDSVLNPKLNWILKSDNQNALNLITAKAQFEQRISDKARLNYGLESNLYFLTPYKEYYYVRKDSFVLYDQSGGTVNNSSPIENAVYGEYIIEPVKGLTINGGLRLWSFIGKDKSFFRPEPRIFLRQLLSNGASVRLGFSVNNQGVNQLSSINLPQPTDAWFPAGKLIKPQQSIQTSFGWSKMLGAGWGINIESYYKRLNGVFDVYSDIEDQTDPQYWVDIVGQGKGNSYGIETILSKEIGPFSGFVSYSLSKTNRTIETINFGNTYPFRWDRRHSFNSIFYYRTSAWSKISFGLTVMSGSAVTVPTSAYYNYDNTLVLNYSSKNNYRLPIYHRVDFSFTKKSHRSTEDLRRYWGINIYNLFMRNNVMFVRVDKKDGVNGFTVKGISWFPFVPSMFYKIEF